MSEKVKQIESTADFYNLFTEEDRDDPRKHVIVDFWAPWCGPCKMIEPILEELATEFEQTIEVVQVNVDELPQLAETYGIRSIPAILFFHEEAGSEEPAFRSVGTGPKKMYVDNINKHFFGETKKDTK